MKKILIPFDTSIYLKQINEEQLKNVDATNGLVSVAIEANDEFQHYEGDCVFLCFYSVITSVRLTSILLFLTIPLTPFYLPLFSYDLIFINFRDEIFLSSNTKNTL